MKGRKVLTLYSLDRGRSKGIVVSNRRAGFGEGEDMAHIDPFSAQLAALVRNMPDEALVELVKNRLVGAPVSTGATVTAPAPAPARRRGRPPRAAAPPAAPAKAPPKKEAAAKRR